MFVNSVLKSVYFWGVVVILVLLLWATKGNVSKVVEIIKLLAKLAVNLFALFLGIFAIDFKKTLDEVGP